MPHPSLGEIIPFPAQRRARVLARDDYRLVITDKTTLSGHVMAVVFGGALALLAVCGFGL